MSWAKQFNVTTLSLRWPRNGNFASDETTFEADVALSVLGDGIATSLCLVHHYNSKPMEI